MIQSSKVPKTSDFIRKVHFFNHREIKVINDKAVFVPTGFGQTSLMMKVDCSKLFLLVSRENFVLRDCFSFGR